MITHSPYKVCPQCSRYFSADDAHSECQPCRYRRLGIDWTRKYRRVLRKVARKYGQEYSR